MKCKYLKNNSCDLVTNLTKTTCIPITEETCKLCNACSLPRSLNKITAGLSIVTLMKNNLYVKETHGYLSEYTHPTVNEDGTIIDNTRGVGTELAKLIKWFAKDPSDKCNCNQRILQMNKWGIKKCVKRKETILRWLKHSAMILKKPYSRSIASLLVDVAIRNAIIYQTDTPPQEECLSCNG